LCLQVELF